MWRRRVSATNVRVRLVGGPHAGKGAAVRRGIEEAQGDVIFLIDVDLPVSLEHIAQFLESIQSGADVVIAERPEDREFTGYFRWLLSRGLRVLQQAIVFHSRRFRDTQCGFKAFRAPLVREIAKQQIVAGGMYDLEYLYVALLSGANVEAVTVSTNGETRESRINTWKCLRRDPVDVARIKIRGLVGAYHHVATR